jgi:hypothetical protein
MVTFYGNGQIRDGNQQKMNSLPAPIKPPDLLEKRSRAVFWGGWLFIGRGSVATMFERRLEANAAPRSESRPETCVLDSKRRDEACEAHKSAAIVSGNVARTQRIFLRELNYFAASAARERRAATRGLATHS